jgi:hypothetical protein
MLPLSNVSIPRGLRQRRIIFVGLSTRSALPACSAIAGVATRQANAMVAKQRNSMQRIAASPRGYELKHAADFVRIRELLTLSATSAMDQKQTFAEGGPLRC